MGRCLYSGQICAFGSCSASPYRMIENEGNKPEKPAASSTDSAHETEGNKCENTATSKSSLKVGFGLTRRRVCRPACPACSPFCHGRCMADGLYCYFGTCSSSPYRDYKTTSEGRNPSCQHYFDYCYYSMDMEYHCYYYYACNKNHIQVEGKTQFYESFLQDQKEITLK